MLYCFQNTSIGTNTLAAALAETMHFKMWVGNIAQEADLFSEAHLQQPVSLVKHQGLQVLQSHRLCVAQVINQPSLQ